MLCTMSVDTFLWARLTYCFFLWLFHVRINLKLNLNVYSSFLQFTLMLDCQKCFSLEDLSESMIITLSCLINWVRLNNAFYIFMFRQCLSGKYFYYCHRIRVKSCFKSIGKEINLFFSVKTHKLWKSQKLGLYSFYSGISGTWMMFFHRKKNISFYRTTY